MSKYTSSIDAESASILSDHANDIVDELVGTYDRSIDPVLYVAAGIAGCVLASAGIQMVTMNIPGIGDVTMSVNREGETDSKILH